MNSIGFKLIKPHKLKFKHIKPYQPILVQPIKLINLFLYLINELLGSIPSHHERKSHSEIKASETKQQIVPTPFGKLPLIKRVKQGKKHGTQGME